MRIGLDFDNTIVCYDDAFHREAHREGLIEPEFPRSKRQIRDHLRATGREDDWTELQGRLYGERIASASPFPGVQSFLAACREDGVEVFIVSHKTRLPFRGPQVDLHEAAISWLKQQRIAGASDAPLTLSDCWFEETREKKFKRISSLGCTHFVDDLPEFLLDPAFPNGVERYLFAPGDDVPDVPCASVRSWIELTQLLFPAVSGCTDLPR